MLLGDDDDDKVVMIFAAKDNGSDDSEDESMTFFRAGETWKLEIAKPRAGSGGRLGEPHSQAPPGGWIGGDLAH